MLKKTDKKETSVEEQKELKENKTKSDKDIPTDLAGEELVKNEKSAKDEKETVKKGVKVAKKKNRRVIVTIVILFLILVLGALGTVAVGIYRFNWNDPYTNKIIKLIPYPAAFVNWHIIKYSDFRADLKTLQYFYQKQGELYPDQASSLPTTDQMKKDVLDQMVKDELIKQISAKRNLKVTSDDIENEFKLIVDQAGSQAEVEKTLKDLYQWNVDQFKNKVLYKFLLSRKLEETIKDEPTIDASTKARAEEVLNKVKAGEKSFEDLAKEYSEDSTAASGGDLGYFTKGQMVAEFEAVAFALEPGKISDLVKTSYGYHIIKVVEKIPSSGDKEETVKASHIVIRFPAIDQWLEGELKKAQIFRWLKT